MKKVIVFFDGEPAKALTVVRNVTSIRRFYSDGQEAHLKVLPTGITYPLNDNQRIYVAADRELAADEILEAARRLL